MLKLLEGSPELTVSLSPSRYLFAYVATVHIAVLLSITWYPLSVAARVAIALFVLLYALYSVGRSGLGGSPNRITLLEIFQRGVWVTRCHGRKQVGIVSATVWKWLIVIYLRNAGGRDRSLVIFPDSCSADDHRRLRVLLQHCLVVDSE